MEEIYNIASLEILRVCASRAGVPIAAFRNQVREATQDPYLDDRGISAGIRELAAQGKLACQGGLVFRCGAA